MMDAYSAEDITLRSTYDAITHQGIIHCNADLSVYNDPKVQNSKLTDAVLCAGDPDDPALAPKANTDYVENRQKNMRKSKRLRSSISNLFTCASRQTKAVDQ